ncbi:DUF2530 domain-containing protein [Streptosporangium sp. CA-135522]|uniref:DUF2530 domain-containing protein n=1 Tax=Streptosporangium sp. CA-135522 TaxID=3240072 RepID=UPI003D939709
MNQPSRPDLRPLKTNDTATILAGTCLWAVALVVLLIMQPDPGHRWWIWTCVSGICGGLFGLLYVRRRDRREPPSAEAPIEPATAIPPVFPAPPAP